MEGVINMNTLDCIKNRISVRSFLDKDVEDEKLRIIAQAGMEAPTAKNTRDFVLTVVRGSRLQQINDTMYEILDESARPYFMQNGKFNFYRGGNALIVVSFGPKSIMTEQNTGCVMQNMYLAATELGLGSCWINQFYKVENNKLFSLLGLEDGYKPFAALSVGYTDVMPDKKERDGKIVFLD